MRVYHFLNARYGVEAIRRRRLKVATLHELNDPFELLGVNLQDETLRPALRRLKDRTAKQLGLLCFSRDWHNPVLWSHYADRHTGICLGFDVPATHLFLVNYASRRIVLATEDLRSRDRDMDTVMKCLFTKYTHWRYEAEARIFINLAETQLKNGIHFAKFADTLNLRTIIVGAQSAVTRRTVHEALGDLLATVEVFKSRLAFGTFRVVRQKRRELWS